MAALKMLISRLHLGNARPWAPDRKDARLERRVAERRGNVIILKGREQSLRFAARAAGFGIYDLDLASGEVRWSPELKAIAGISSEDEPGSLTWLAEIAHPEDREHLRRQLQASLDPAGSGEYEESFRVLRPNGEVHQVTSRGWTFFAGVGADRHPLAATGIVMDATASRPDWAAFAASRAGLHDLHPEAANHEFEVSRLLHELQVHQVELQTQNEELRQARREIQTALERYTQLYDHAPVGYFTLAPDGTIYQLNLAGARLLGDDRAHLVNKRFGLFVDHPDRPNFNAFLAQVFAGHALAGGHARKSCELALRHPDQAGPGAVIHFEAVADDVHMACNAIAVDITEKKQATEELVRSNLELQQFAYVAAHDLQTPLRAIGSFAQLLQREYGGQLGVQAETWLNLLVRHAERMKSLIHDLLAYSGVDSLGRPFEAVDLSRVFDEVVDSLAANIRDTGAVISRGDLPTLPGDRTQLAQLLQNLIENGIKYRGSEPPWVQVSAEPQGSQWLVSVRDNGIGIDPRYHERIFEIFRRLHSQQAYPGTGIGLAICRRVIEHHGGRIWVESQLGAGSTFYFTLPDSSAAG